METANGSPATSRRSWPLGVPFVFAAVFFALSVGTSAHWLLGVGLVLGPILFMFMTIYLCISSDTNGASGSPA